MAAGNFNLQLPIAGSGFIEWPAGPLFPAVGEMMLRVEVWVMQTATGAIQMTFQINFPAHPMAWIADQVWYPRPPGPNLPWAGGRFQRGPALGTAVAIARKGNVQSYYWWSQEVLLV